MSPNARVVIDDLDRIAEQTDNPFDKGCLRGAADYIAALEGRIAGLLEAVKP